MRVTHHLWSHPSALCALQPRASGAGNGQGKARCSCPHATRSPHKCKRVYQLEFHAQEKALEIIQLLKE